MPWHPAAQPIPLAAEHDPLVLAMLGRVAGRLRLVLPAWGQAAPPAGATVTGSCRMVCGIDGINHMLVPRGESVQQVTLRADGCVAVDHRAWNQPLGLQARTFLTVDVGRDRIRCYLRRHRGRQSSAGEHAMILMLRQPQAATRLLVAALEALLPGDPDPALAGATVRALLLQVRAELRLPARAPEASWLGLSEWLHQRLPAEVSRDEAAAAIGVHPNHISRLVRRHAGTGFARWVAERRIELACALLAGTGLSAAEAGRRCGIGNAAHFSRVFHAHRGLSPGAWRRAGSADPLNAGGS